MNRPALTIDNVLYFMTPASSSAPISLSLYDPHIPFLGFSVHDLPDYTPTYTPITTVYNHWLAPRSAFLLISSTCHSRPRLLQTIIILWSA